MSYRLTRSIGAVLPAGFEVSSSLLDSITRLGLEPGDRLQSEVLEMLAGSGNYDADILFIGAGPGGYVGAIRAGRLGARTVIVEKNHIGGTCLNVGCIPTKALLSTVEIIDNIKRAADFGISVSDYSVDYPKIVSRKDKIVTQLRNGVGSLLKGSGVRQIQGTGKLVDAHTVEVTTDSGKTERITAKNIIIATGSVPALLPMPGFEVGEKVWTNTEVLAATSVPKSLLVVGGGYVGLEFGYTFARLGSDVTVVEMLPNIAGTMDREIAGELEKSLKKSGLKIRTNTSVTAAEDTAAGKLVTIKNADGSFEKLEFEKILVAVGRRPFTSGIGLEDVGVATERGRVLVDDHMRTNVPGIYAIGDCIGDPMLAHTAFHEAIVAVSNILGHDERVDYKAFPGVVFTHPEVGSVGLTEEQAREKFGDNIRIGKFPFNINGKAMGMGEREGFAKVITDTKYGEILGVHIIGPHATDMIAEAVVAIQSELTVDDLAACIHPHPTLSEVVHEAMLDTVDMALHKP